jgi:hypothetical protein
MPPAVFAARFIIDPVLVNMNKDPFGLSLSKPCAKGPFDKLRVNGRCSRLFGPDQ